MDTKTKQGSAGGRLPAAPCTPIASRIPAEPPAPAALVVPAEPPAPAALVAPAARSAPARTRHPVAARLRIRRRVLARSVAAACLAVALACAVAVPAFGAPGVSGITDVTEGTADTVITGEVKCTDDVISVELPLSMHMDIKTNGSGALDSAATPEVSSSVKNNTRHRAIAVSLYETKDPSGLLDDVVLKLNGKDISASVGPGTPGHAEQELVSRLAPGGGQGVLSLAASETSPGHVIPEQRTTVTITVKASAI